MPESHLQEPHLSVAASILTEAKGTRMERALRGKAFTPLQEGTTAECPPGRHKPCVVTSRSATFNRADSSPSPKQGKAKLSL